MSTRNDTIGVLAFVTATRTLLFFVSLAMALPIFTVRRYLPSTERETPRLDAFLSLLHAETIGRLPSWIEQNSRVTFMVKTSRGMQTLDRLVNNIPDRVFTAWRQFGIVVMTLFVGIWALILIYTVSMWVNHTATTLTDLFNWLLGYDWLSLLNTQSTTTEYSLLDRITAGLAAIPHFYHTIYSLTITAIVTVIIWTLLMLPLLPGLVLHELGHYAAIRDAGGTVESYGILMIGPLIAGAFVEPANDVALLEKDDQFAIWSAGIANSLLWGTLLLTTGYLLGGSNGLITAFTAGNGLAAIQTTPFASLLLLVGALEIGNGFLNAVPIGPVDGGGFIRTQERDWWGFDDALDKIGDW